MKENLYGRQEQTVTHTEIPVGSHRRGTSCNHTDILAHPEGCGIHTNCKTVASDLADLQDSGFDVVCNKSRQNQYFIGSRSLKLAELKMIVDAIQAAKFISESKSLTLIEKVISWQVLIRQSSSSDVCTLKVKLRPQMKQSIIRLICCSLPSNCIRRYPCKHAIMCSTKNKPMCSFLIVVGSHLFFNEIC